MSSKNFYPTEGFHDSYVDDTNVNLLPKLPKADEQEENKSCYEMLEEYFSTLSKETASKAETQDVVQPSTEIELGKKGNKEQPSAQSGTEQAPAKDLEVLPAWLSLFRKQRAIYVDPQLLALHLLGPDAPNPLCFVNYPECSEPLIFMYRDGFYGRLTQQYLRGYIKSFIPPEHRNKKDIEAVAYEINTEIASLNGDAVDADEDIINFENGLLHLGSWTLTEHTPDVLSTVRIPCNFNPDLTLEDAPIFSAFLDELTSNDNIDRTFLLEYIGAILSNVPGYRFKKLLILHGPGNTGKSQLRNLVEWLIGPQNHHSIDLTRLCEKFGPAQLYGKRLVGSGEMSSAEIDEIAILKELTGGDDINGENKYKSSFTFRFSGYLWFNCNNLPKFSGDHGKHVFERFCIIQCMNVIPPEKQDSLLLDKMKAEREAIVSAALKCFKEVIERGYKFTESESMSIAREEYAEDLNSETVTSFVRECCDLTKGRAKRSDVYHAYEAWCSAKGKNGKTKSEFFSELASSFGIYPRKSSEYYFPLTLKSNVFLSLGIYR